MKSKSRKKSSKKKIERKVKVKNTENSSKLFSFLLIGGILVSALLFESLKSVPVGASSDNIANVSFKLPKLNSQKIETRLLNTQNFKDFNKKLVIEKENSLDQKIVIIENDFSQTIKIQEKEPEVIANVETPIKVAKANETKVEQIISNSLDNEIIFEKKTTTIPTTNETIKIAEDTSTKTFTIDGEEVVVKKWALTNCSGPWTGVSEDGKTLTVISGYENERNNIAGEANLLLTCFNAYAGGAAAIESIWKGGEYGLLDDDEMFVND